MSKPNEPPLALESWTITVELTDGSDFKLGAGDIEENLRDDINDVVEQYVEQHIDHLKGKYGQEIEQAEDLHAQNSERFVNYEKKSD